MLPPEEVAEAWCEPFLEVAPVALASDEVALEAGLLVEEALEVVVAFELEDFDVEVGATELEDEVVEEESLPDPSNTTILAFLPEGTVTTQNAAPPSPIV